LQVKFSIVRSTRSWTSSLTKLTMRRRKKSLQT